MRYFLIFLVSVLTLVTSVPSYAVGKTIACPKISVKQYGKTFYFDPAGHGWRLTWLSRQTPHWESASIPQSSLCSKGRSGNGIPISYQCAVFQCKSQAVIATMGQNHAMKCFSAYVSTQNSFYCDSFTTKGPQLFTKNY